MAKKSMINKQQRPQKYKTREYTRCSICGRPLQFLENMASAVSVLENLLTKVKFLELRNLAGNK